MSFRVCVTTLLYNHVYRMIHPSDCLTFSITVSARVELQVFIASFKKQKDFLFPYIFVCVIIWSDFMCSPRADSARSGPRSQGKVKLRVPPVGDQHPCSWLLEVSGGAEGASRQASPRPSGGLQHRAATRRGGGGRSHCGWLSWPVFRKEADLRFLVDRKMMERFYLKQPGK